MGTSAKWKLTDFSRKNEELYPVDVSLLFLHSEIPFHNFNYAVNITKAFSKDSKLSDFKSNNGYITYRRSDGYTTYKRSLSIFRFGSNSNFYNFTKSLHSQLRLNKETLRDNVC